jgi:exosortase A-associated hydrolase 2
MISFAESKVGVSLQAFHIPSPFGDLAAVYHLPEAGIPHLQDLLFIHAFAHEHYVARPVMANAWRRLAAEGTGVLSIDLPGCGDSTGDFGEATWANWLSAISIAHRWLTGKSGRRPHIGGLRLGAALALEAVAHIDAKSILLLQPVIRGDEMMTQFLRVRVAFSGLRGEVREKETTQKLRSRIAAGEKLEVGGFFLAPELALEIDRIDLAAQAPPIGSPIHWIETGPAIFPRVATTVDQWRATGASVSLTHADVKPYWVHTRGLVSEYDPLFEQISRVSRECR